MINDQRVAVEALDHDGVLSAEIIGWEGIGLPAKTLVCIGEVATACAVCVCGRREVLLVFPAVPLVSSCSGIKWALTVKVKATIP